MAHDVFGPLLNDTVALVKPDGTRVDGVRASVQRGLILVSDSSLPIEEGDTIERERPGGLLERYTVLDAGYQGDFHGIPAHFQMQVRKETEISRTPPTPSTTYYLSGPNPRVNNNSVDASVNVAHAPATQLFDELRAALIEIADEAHRQQLLADVEEMELAQGGPSFLARYQAFMQDAANHMTVVGPFLPALTRLLG